MRTGNPCGSLLKLLCAIILLQTHINEAPAAMILKWRNWNSKPGPHLAPLGEENRSSCSFFTGSWVPVEDGSFPAYQSHSCLVISKKFNCISNGRPDTGYQKYRWKPFDCELPWFDGLYFLKKMESKSMMVVGDSLGDNQWQSLICMILAAVPSAVTSMSSNGDTLTKFIFQQYGFTISYYRAPYLVDIDIVEGKRVLKLEEINGNGNAWLSADVLLFNTGHWWNHLGSLQGWDYMKLGNQLFADMNRSVALQIALSTWANWVQTYIDFSKTHVFFQSISPTHNRLTGWTAGEAVGDGGGCLGQTRPTNGPVDASSYLDLVNVEDNFIKNLPVPVHLLDITALSEPRIDGHPSIYRGDLNHGMGDLAGAHADCSHWCLPGVPDTWNQLLYALLLQVS